MKIVIISYSGNVGKTTTAAHLLAPRMNGAPLFAIETVNETAEGLGVSVEKIKGTQFRQLFKPLLMLDDAIIDVGASNAEAFLDGLVRFEIFHFEFQRFIVPTTSRNQKNKKRRNRRVASPGRFSHLPEKIRLLFNRVAVSVDEEFPPIFGYARKGKKLHGRHIRARGFRKPGFDFARRAQAHDCQRVVGPDRLQGRATRARPR